jgi:hypothetical protein
MWDATSQYANYYFCVMKSGDKIAKIEAKFGKKQTRFSQPINISNHYRKSFGFKRTVTFEYFRRWHLLFY